MISCDMNRKTDLAKFCIRQTTDVVEVTKTLSGNLPRYFQIDKATATGPIIGKHEPATSIDWR